MGKRAKGKSKEAIASLMPSVHTPRKSRMWSSLKRMGVTSDSQRQSIISGAKPSSEMVEYQDGDFISPLGVYETDDVQRSTEEIVSVALREAAQNDDFRIKNNYKRDKDQLLRIVNQVKSRGEQSNVGRSPELLKDFIATCQCILRDGLMNNNVMQDDVASQSIHQIVDSALPGILLKYERLPFEIAQTKEASMKTYFQQIQNLVATQKKSAETQVERSFDSENEYLKSMGGVYHSQRVRNASERARVRDTSKIISNSDEDGTLLWYTNGLRHREDGPAVIHGDGAREWTPFEFLLNENEDDLNSTDAHTETRKSDANEPLSDDELLNAELWIELFESHADTPHHK